MSPPVLRPGCSHIVETYVKLAEGTSYGITSTQVGSVREPFAFGVTGFGVGELKAGVPLSVTFKLTRYVPGNNAVNVGVAVELPAKLTSPPNTAGTHEAPLFFSTIQVYTTMLCPASFADELVPLKG